MADPAYPRVSIKYCTQCKWGLRAAYYAQELMSTFSTALGEVALVPSTGGTFVVELDLGRDALSVQGGVTRKQLWDRKADGGFPETKELKKRVRDMVEPGRDLGHVDGKKSTKPDAAATAAAATAASHPKPSKPVAEPAAKPEHGDDSGDSDEDMRDDESKRRSGMRSTWHIDPSTLNEQSRHDLMMHRRYKLQKAFQHPEGPLPTAEEMPTYSDTLQALEDWPDSVLTREIIATTKIYKVLRVILKIPDDKIPLNEQLRFKARMQALYKRYCAILERPSADAKSSAVKNEGTIVKEKEIEGKACKQDEGKGAGGGDMEVCDDCA